MRQHILKGLFCSLVIYRNHVRINIFVSRMMRTLHVSYVCGGINMNESNNQLRDRALLCPSKQMSNSVVDSHDSFRITEKAHCA